jgi:hypothetical protein
MLLVAISYYYLKSLISEMMVRAPVKKARLKALSLLKYIRRCQTIKAIKFGLLAVERLCYNTEQFSLAFRLEYSS